MTEQAQPLRVALLGCGVVGTEVARLLDDAGRRPGRPRRPPRSSSSASPCAAPTATARPGVDAGAVHHRRRTPWSRATSTWSSRSSAASSRPARLILAAMAHGASRRHREQGAARRGRRRRCTPRPTKHGVDLYFEAAVAGAIPLLRPLRESLAGDRVTGCSASSTAPPTTSSTRWTPPARASPRRWPRPRRSGTPRPTRPPTSRASTPRPRPRSWPRWPSTPGSPRPTSTARASPTVSAADVASAREMGHVVKLLAICERSDAATAGASACPCACTRR